MSNEEELAYDEMDNAKDKLYGSLARKTVELHQVRQAEKDLGIKVNPDFEDVVHRRAYALARDRWLEEVLARESLQADETNRLLREILAELRKANA